MSTQRSIQRPLRTHGRHVCMLVTNDMTADSRVSRHGRTLGSAGCRTTVVCELSRQTKRLEHRDNFEIVRVQSRVAEHAKFLEQRLAPSEREQSRFLARRKNPLWVLRLILRFLGISFTQLALLREARRTRADIYCANDLDTLLLAVLAGALDRKVVYDSHELWPDMLVEVPEFLKRILKSYEGLMIKATDSVMTVNEFIAKELAFRHVLRSPVHVVHNCVESSNLDTRRRNGQAKIALYHGLYSPERGLQNLIKASHFLSPDVVLLFRGQGKLEEELKMLARGRGNVRFEPPVPQDEVVKAASLADVGIVPYLPSNLCNYYASPNKLFEYIQAGLPIAASNLPFMSKFLKENHIGKLFDARDPVSIAHALNEITRPSQLKRFRKNVETTRKKYSWESESRRLIEIYGTLLNR